MPPPNSILYKEVGTKNPLANVPKLGRSASKWKKADLDLLGVEYQYDVFDNIRIAIDDVDMPPEIVQSKNLLRTF